MDYLSRAKLVDQIAQLVRHAEADRLRSDLVARYGGERWSERELTTKSNAVRFIDELSNSELLKLRRQFGIKFDPFAPERTSRPSCWIDADDIRLFISHKGDEETLAEDISRQLKADGFSGFVARYGIQAGASWHDELIRALFTMEAFISLHTNGFSRSAWSNNEVGVAFGRRVPMLAISIEEAPDGISASLQAIKVGRDTGQAASLISQYFRGSGQLRNY